MRILLLLIGFASMANGLVAAAADDRKFPYEAIVDAEDGENVRSGPGPKYYPTDKLQRGDRVIVHRHDPGGWCMISPPEGSFSWVRAEHVQRSGDSNGVLKANGVVVHVGSTLNPDEFTTVQANLSKGDAVEILGEKNFSFDDGPRLMLKISPVKREWRWIARKSIVAADALKSDPFPGNAPTRKKRSGPIAEGNLDADAFTKPISTRPAQRDDDLDSTELSQRQPSDNNAVRRTGSDQQVAGREKLTEIDQKFRDMIREDPPTWDLEALESQYKQLDEDVNQPSMNATIALRRDAVKRYRKIQKDYVDFYKLTSETKQRDAQLMSLQAQNDPDLKNVGTQGPTRSNAPPAGMLEPKAAQPTNSLTQSPSTEATPPTGKSAPGFDGAGIVQKMAKTFPGGPQFVLIAPDGKMLSFLQAAPGVDLNRFVGRSMGITGQRARRDDWNADTIVVRSLQPVQLRGSR